MYLKSLCAHSSLPINVRRFLLKKKKIGHKIIASDDKWLQLNNSQADKTETSTGCTAILMPQVEK